MTRPASTCASPVVHGGEDVNAPTPDEAAGWLRHWEAAGASADARAAARALRVERDALRARVAAQQPVIDAAEAWDAAWVMGTAGVREGTALHNALVRYESTPRAALGSAEADEPASPVLLVPDADLPEPRRGAGPVECCGYHRKRCLIGHAHAWARPWYRDGKLQRTNDTWHCHHCGGVCIAEEDGYDEAAAAPVSVAGDDTQPDGPHLVDAAAPAMREVLRRVELGQLSSASAVDILLDWPSRALAEAGAPAQPDDDRPGTCPTCSSAQPHLHPSPDLCPDQWHKPVPVTVASWRREVARWADLLRSLGGVADLIADPGPAATRIAEDMTRALAGAADTEEPTDA